MTDHPNPTAARRGGRLAADLADELAAELDLRLAAADEALVSGFPGDAAGRQPVHTVYVPGDVYRADTGPVWGRAALAAVDDHPDLFAEVAGREDVVGRVRDKLAVEPVEDVRIDFEDGYGARGDDAEDAHVLASARALARSVRDGIAPPFRGIRFKSLEAPTRRRGVRTLTLFVSRLLEDGGSLDGFVVTLPKITSVDQVEAMTTMTERIEESLGLVPGVLRFELQIETSQSILGPDGTALVARMIRAAGHRCTGLHYGTYDYSAFLGVPAAQQSMEHPVADHAKQVMQVAAAGTGVRLSDGSTNVLPVGDQASVRRGWELHARLVRRSLERGFYQGWDLHPAQLPSRFAASYAFYREGFAGAGDRLRRYLEQAGSSVLDEPATARALSDFLVRAADCGAVGAAEVEAATGVDPATVLELARPTRHR